MIRNAVKMLAAMPLFVTFGFGVASAGPLQLDRPEPSAQAAMIQQVDWYCGPNCQSWRHRHWEGRGYQQRYGYYHPHYWHHHWSRYGYNYPRSYYKYGYAY
jgi:hypothetical protein